ncbi:MAG: transporter substrate-binding domain-containing protein [Gammaproteobacteria bacterium]|jgi:membrane-bound lytic murein transglycosylase F
MPGKYTDHINPCFTKRLFLFVVITTILFTVGCGSSDNDADRTQANMPVADSSFKNYVEQGDLPGLKKRGNLRILISDAGLEAPYLPRRGLPIHYESELAKRFAQQLDLEPQWIYVEQFNQLIPMLLDGRGDIIVSNLTITDQRKDKVAFSVPVAITTEQLVVRADDTPKKVEDLRGRKVALLKSSSYWDTMMKHKADYPEIKLQPVASNKSVLELLDDVAMGKYDATVADSNIVNAILPVHPELKVAFDVSRERPIGWAIRPDAGELQNEVNKFLNHENLKTQRASEYKTDLDGIKERNLLRVITRNNAATYFLWRGELMGFEYELAKRFADQLGVRLEMIVAPSRDVLLTWLVQGKGDMVAASLTIPDTNSSPTVRYSRPYHKVYEIVVARDGEPDIEDIKQLSGRTFHVRRSSAYWETLQGIKQQGVDINVKTVPESEETEQIIAKVADGEYDLTISDSHILDIELTWRDDIKGLLNLGKEVSHGWVMRKDSPELLKAVNQYIDKEYRGLFYNITRTKYFEKPKTIARRLQQRVDRGDGQLSPYDDVAREFASQYNFDWRMLIAQMYQESRFDPKAKSWAGALGLMQVMPRTARELGITNLNDPRLSVKAGVKYLDWVRDRFEPELSVKDRMWFTLAAYNAGVGHVRDARNLAQQKGWESTRWFGNVERAMLLLSKRQYARKAKHGYVRGREPVQYVRKIRERYRAYVKLTETAVADAE